jgi:hypothetical protein
VAVTRVSGLQPTLSSRVRVAVRFTFRAPLAAWCHRVPWPHFVSGGVVRRRSRRCEDLERERWTAQAELMKRAWLG